MSENKKKSPTFVEVEGDAIELFFKSETSAIIMHGANCQKQMGAGIAAQIRHNIPPLFYLDQYDSRLATQRFGSFSAVVLADTQDQLKIGANLYTQYNPGANFDIDALKTSIKALTFTIPPEQRHTFTVYVPQIGCGIGGGSWKDVLPVLKDVLSEFNVVAVTYKASPPPKPQAIEPATVVVEDIPEAPKKRTRRSK
jgi:O-acetyl-ADP-ribose deacetylase (regulator of RNase III)